MSPFGHTPRNDAERYALHMSMAALIDRNGGAGLACCYKELAEQELKRHFGRRRKAGPRQRRAE